MRRVTVTTIAALAFAAAIAGAQVRFEMTDQSAIAGAPRLRVIAMRDNALKTCYLVFVADTAGEADIASRFEATNVPDAMAARDRRLADLLHAFEQERGAIPGTIIPNPLKYDWQAQAAQFEFALTVLAHEFARLEQQIERQSTASHGGITAVPAPCTPAAPAAPTDHLPEKRR